MAMTGADLRRWIANFEAAEQADRDQKRREGPRPDQSIKLALSLMVVAARLDENPAREDPRDRAEDLHGYECWARLRAAAGKP